MIDLSIVVVTWNTRELVLDCLESIDRELRSRPDRGLETETVVVDNGSQDGSAAAIRTRFPWAQVVALDRNLGYAAGINAGLARIRGRYVALLNSDTRVVGDALQHCVRFLRAHRDVGVVGPQLLNPDGTRQNSFHNVPRLSTELFPKSAFQLLFPRRFPSRRSTGGAPVDVEAVAGAAPVLRASLLDRVGRIPEDYFFFLEETDWCVRVRRAGWRVVHLPEARVIHLLGASSKRKYAALTRIEYHRSLYRYFRRYRGVTGMAMMLGVRFSKAVFYVASQAPLALFSTRARARWRQHVAVLGWHLQGCPARVGLVQLAGEPQACAPQARARLAG